MQVSGYASLGINHFVDSGNLIGLESYDSRHIGGGDTGIVAQETQVERFKGHRKVELFLGLVERIGIVVGGRLWISFGMPRYAASW